VLLAPEVMAHAIREVMETLPEVDSNVVIQTLQSIEPVWDELFQAEQTRIIQLLVDRVTVSAKGIRVDMKTEGMKELIQSILAEPEMLKAA
jgi:hypothetical protein